MDPCPSRLQRNRNLLDFKIRSIEAFWMTCPLRPRFQLARQIRPQLKERPFRRTSSRPSSLTTMLLMTWCQSCRTCHQSLKLELQNWDLLMKIGICSIQSMIPSLVSTHLPRVAISIRAVDGRLELVRRRLRMH